MTANIGYNFGWASLGGREAYMREILKLAGTNTNHLFITAPQGGVNSAGDVQVALDTANFIGGDNPIVWRTYSKKEGDWRNYGTADSIFRQYIAEGDAVRGLIRDCIVNEPSLGNFISYPTETRAICTEFSQWQAEIIRKSAREGIPVLAGAFSVGTPYHGLWGEGIFDEMIYAIAEAQEMGLPVGYSVHEYNSATPLSEIVPYELHLEPELYYARLRQALNQPVWDFMQHQNGSEYWRIRRMDWIVQRHRQLGLPDPDFYVTECYTDDAHSGMVEQILRDRYGLPECNFNLGGQQSFMKFYQAMVGSGNDPLEVIRLSLKLLRDKVYNVPYVKGIHLFAANRDWGIGDAGKRRCYNWLNRAYDGITTYYIPMLNASQREPQPQPPEEDSNVGAIIENPTWQEGTISVSGVNVRDSSAGDVIASAEGLFYCLRSEEFERATLNGTRYEWRLYRYLNPDDTVTEGYIASAVAGYETLQLPDTVRSLLLGEVPDEPDEPTEPVEIDYGVLARELWNNAPDDLVDQLVARLTTNGDVSGSVARWILDNDTIETNVPIPTYTDANVPRAYYVLWLLTLAQQSDALDELREAIENTST